MGLPGVPGVKGPSGHKVIIYACMKSHFQLLQMAVLLMQSCCAMLFAETMAEFHLTRRYK